MRVLRILFLAFPLTAAVIPGRYIVELSTEPVADHVAQTRELLHSPAADQHRAAIRAQQTAVRARIESAGGIISGSVENVRNALFIRIPDERAAQLSSIPGVRAVYPERLFKKLLDHAMAIHQVPAAWTQVGLWNAGAGIKIAMIDTGISINHPAFHGLGFTAPSGYPLWDSAADKAYTNAKVIVARSYARYFITTDPDLTAQDDDGHGTGTAMAAAGITSFGTLTTITGVAPEAWLGVYKVFGTPGLNDSAPESAVINAIDDAVNDGMDVINLSLGSTEAGPASQDPEVAAIESAAAAGVIVTVSAGNNGPNPATVGTPAIAPSAIAVGASLNDRQFAAFVTFPNGINFQARAGNNSLQLPAVSGRLIDISAFDDTAQACSALPPNSLSGGVALISRGVCLFADKLKNALAAGAVAAVVYDNVPNEPLVTMAAGGVALPANFVSQQDGAALVRLAAGGPQCNLKFALPQFVDPSGLASFSAAGPTPDVTIKPDLVAVGTNIYTAAESILSSGDLYDPTGFTLAQGTSFSAPIVAGAAALVKQARPGLTAQQYRSLLINSAGRAFSAPGGAAHIQQAGGGLLNVFAALNASATVSPVSLSLGSGSGSAAVTRTLAISNVGSVDDTFQISAAPLSPGGPVPTPSVASVTLSPGASASITLQFSPAGLPSGSYEGFITIQGAKAAIGATVPFWYGVPSSTPGFVTPLYSEPTASVSARVSQAAVFRVTDSAGLPVSTVTPTVSVIAGGGQVLSVAPISGLGSGVYTFTARMGPAPGSNQFQITAGPASAVVSITAQ
jgi:subtilisin family serine protease